MEKIGIDKSIITDLVRLTSEINNKVESLELMGDTEFMGSLKKSDVEVENREFVNWNEL